MGFGLQERKKKLGPNFPSKIQDGRRFHGNRWFTHFFKLFYQKNIVTKYENNVVGISEKMECW